MANRKGKSGVAHTSHTAPVPAAPAQPSADPVAPAPPFGPDFVAPAPLPSSLPPPPDPIHPLASRTNVRGSDEALLRHFGLIVRAARTRRALSQSDLGKRAKMHRTHVSLIESGTREARLLTICALAAAMRMQPGDLMPPIS